MIDCRDIFEPLRELYVPSGWHINKNHLFDINKEGFVGLADESLVFKAKEFFVSDTVFYAKHEYPYSTTQILSCVVYMGCKFLNYDDFNLEYDISLIVTLGGKKKKQKLISLDELASNPHEAAEKVSTLMKMFSHEKLVDFNTAEVING